MAYIVLLLLVYANVITVRARLTKLVQILLSYPYYTVTISFHLWNYQDVESNPLISDSAKSPKNTSFLYQDNSWSPAYFERDVNGVAERLTMFHQALLFYLWYEQN